EQEARASEARMRQFIADASHELRTPLTSIRGFAELHRKQGGGPGSDVDRSMGRIETEATRMGGLVEDLLLLARLDRDRPLARESVDLVPLVADAAFDLHSLGPDRPVDVQLPPTVGGGGARGADDEGSSGPVLVAGDEARLRQVLANLVSNALLHTPDGTPVLLRLGVDPVGRQAILEVADQGPGLDGDQAVRVFERFYRVDKARTRASGGAGLGLSIVASITQAHGGTVEVDTAPGRGACFRVRLPLAVPSPEGPAAGLSASTGEAPVDRAPSSMTGKFF
ncbi:MAG TPA: HAMP domain-containing sensor histidine kinase, partial [Acidimicrobiales bacterium]